MAKTFPLRIKDDPEAGVVGEITIPDYIEQHLIHQIEDLVIEITVEHSGSMISRKIVKMEIKNGADR